MNRAMKISVLVVLLLTLAAQVLAQGPPTPAPELKKVDFFAGDWTFSGDMKPGPMGPGGKVTGTEHCEWMNGKFFLACHSSWQTPMGPMSAASFLGYNPEQSHYTYNEFNSMGENTVSTGMMEGETWTWNGQQKMGEMVINGRFTIKQTSATTYDFKYEMAPEGSEFKTVMDGVGTKK